ncbi:MULTISPECIES: sugar kinase [unclassified Streptomyces]|uniref:sugar kinase n=1 Tax=unclassified Streptomyces TaxID=2593676 RepID=UPI001F0465CD|nr:MULTISPECIES: sugar kinase [unclassified Streptomyces]MCH0566054.1 sugar kinase [Streptomyces sp. MUM 2J]MCH0571324.1 sugar kinase [Streptomyces sp. MUM 136J]
MTASLPHQAARPGEQAPSEDRRHAIRRRALTLLIIVLLIGVPAGYLVISANQSRDAGKDKEERYSATGLTAGWPSRVQRRLYQVPVPAPSSEVAYYETNNWKTSRLYVQFQTSPANLDWFLEAVGTDRSHLREGDVTIGGRDRKVTGWTFTGSGPWWGVVHEQEDPAPTQDIVVNMADPERPMVYVVSRTVP